MIEFRILSTTGHEKSGGN